MFGYAQAIDDGLVYPTKKKEKKKKKKKVKIGIKGSFCFF
jgi:hypothetical protein